VSLKILDNGQGPRKGASDSELYSIVKALQYLSVENIPLSEAQLGLMEHLIGNENLFHPALETLE